MNSNDGLNLVGIPTRTPLVILRFGWANRNSIAQLLFALSRTSGSNVGLWDTSQDSSVSIICIVVAHLNPACTVLVAVLSDFFEKLSRLSLHCHMSQKCRSVYVKPFNLQHIILQSSNYNMSVPTCKKTHRVFVINAWFLGAFTKLRKATIKQYVYKPTRCAKFLWLDFIFQYTLYMFRTVLVHHQEQLYKLCITFGVCRYMPVRLSVVWL